VIFIQREARRERRQELNQGWKSDHSAANVVPSIHPSFQENSPISVMSAAPAQRAFLEEETMSPIKAISFPVGEMDIPNPRSIHSDPGLRVSSVEGQKSLEGISRAIQEEGEDIRLNYSLDRPTGQVVVSMVDGKSGKVVREIPPHELLVLAASMKEFEGIFFDKEI
jgi:uncharacterized FlaG/YvyC family protein